MLTTAGLPEQYFYYPFPDYRLPSVILSDLALAKSDFDPVDLLARSHSRDYSGSIYRSFDETLAFPALHSNQLIADLSNSYLVLATKDSNPVGNPADLASTYSVQRKPEFAVQTRFVRSESEIRVVKEHLVSVEGRPGAVEVGGTKITNRLVESEYLPGRQVLWDLLKARASKGGVDSIAQALLPWADYLLRQARIPATQLGGARPQLAAYVLPGEFLDCTPFNLLDVGDKLLPIDLEWQSDGDLELGWVLTRGVTYSMRSGGPSPNHVRSITEVIEAICDRVGISISEAEVEGWLEKESAFQSSITGNPYIPMTAEVTFSGLRSFMSEIAVAHDTLAAREGQIASLYAAADQRSQEVANLATERDRLVRVEADLRIERDVALAAQEDIATTLTCRIEKILDEKAAFQTLIEKILDEKAAFQTLIEKIVDEKAVLQGEASKLQALYDQALAIGAELEARIHAGTLERDTLQGQLNNSLATLNSILGSRGWRALSFYYRCRDASLRPFRLLRDEYLIRRSGLFDQAWYLRQYPDVKKAGVAPLRHYLRHGAAEGRDPNPYFDSDWYLTKNPDVAAAGVNPLRHYASRGSVEGRDPSPRFSSRRYLALHPDIAAAKLNPLQHFLRSSKSGEASPLVNDAYAGDYLEASVGVPEFDDSAPTTGSGTSRGILTSLEDHPSVDHEVAVSEGRRRQLRVDGSSFAIVASRTNI